MTKVVFILAFLVFIPVSHSATFGENPEQRWSISNYHAPAVQITSNQSELKPNQRITLRVTSSVDNDGDSLNFFWQSKVGKFLNGSVDFQEVTWQAPSSLGIFAITIYASDGKGRVGTTQIQIKVLQYPQSNSNSQKRTVHQPSPPAKCGFPNRSLVKIYTDPGKVYQVTNCIRRAFKSLGDIIMYGYSSAQVKSQIQGYHKHILEEETTLGSPLPQKYFPKTYSKCQFPNETLVKSLGEATVYIIKNGQRRPLTLTGFNANNYSWSSILWELKDKINSCPLGSIIKGIWNPPSRKKVVPKIVIKKSPPKKTAITIPKKKVRPNCPLSDYMLVVRFSEATVFYIRNGYKLPVTYQGFVQNGFSWGAVIRIPKSLLKNCPTGPTIRSRL